MQDSNILVDRKALEMSRSRVIGRDECFLHDLVISEIKDRIQNINRDFQLIAIVTGLPAPWRKAFPEATIIEDKENLDLSQSFYDLVIHGMAPVSYTHLRAHET